MIDRDLQTRKIEFVQEFLKVQNEEVVSWLEKILQTENRRLDQTNFEPMSVEEFNSRIDRSIDDSENGKLIKAADLKAKMEKWP